MSPEVSGLRKRLASFKPLNVSPVDEMRVRREENGDLGAGHEYCEKSTEEAFGESLSRSFSSMSSRSSRSTADEDDRGGDGPDASSRNTQDDAGATSPDDTVSQPSSKKRFVATARNELPPAPPNITRPSLRVPQASSRDIKYARNNVSSPTSSWFGLDFSIIIALVSPIGNLLTGSDHIKNVLLLLLLIYYLHQLVEGTLTYTLASPVLINCNWDSPMDIISYVGSVWRASLSNAD